MPTPPPNQQSDDDEDDAVEHGAADQRDDPADDEDRRDDPQDRRHASPTVPRCNRKQIHVLSLPTEPIGLCPLNPSAQASEALDLVQAGPDGWVEMGSKESIEVQAEERGYHISRGGTFNRGAEPAWGWN
jgi:hypothetical protein